MQSSSEEKQCSCSHHGPSSTDSTSIEEILALPRVKEAPKKMRVGSKSEAQYVSGMLFLNRLCSKRKEQVKGRSKPTKNSSKPRSPKVSYRKRTAAAGVRDKTCKKHQKVLTDQSEEENDCFCSVCSVLYGTDDKLWIQCSGCDSWFHTEHLKLIWTMETSLMCFYAWNVIVESFFLLFHNLLECFIITNVTLFKVP